MVFSSLWPTAVPKPPTDENDPFLLGESESQGYRNSEDKRKNQRGGELNDICKLNDLLISNGRKPGDLFGK